MMISIYPAVGALFSTLGLLVYKLNDKYMDTITK